MIQKFCHNFIVGRHAETLMNIDTQRPLHFIFPAALKIPTVKPGQKVNRAEVFNGRTAKTSEVPIDEGVARKIIPGDVFIAELVIKANPDGSQEQSVTPRKRVFNY